MTKSLVDSFKKGHITIQLALDEVGQASRAYSAAKPKILILQQVLLNHLGRQNDDFMDDLALRHIDNHEKAKMLEFLLHDIKEMKVEYLKFFEKYPGTMGDQGSRKFPKDFADFTLKVLERIHIEEEYLFPLIEGLPCGDDED